MHFEWLLSPTTHYAALAIGLGACLALFIAGKLELQVFRRAAGESHKSMHVNVCGLSEEIQHIRDTVRKLEAAPPIVPVGPGLNLSRRAQALKMHRRGETVNSIAPALGAPRNEIELLLKVHQLVNRRSLSQ